MIVLKNVKPCLLKAGFFYDDWSDRPFYCQN